MSELLQTIISIQDFLDAQPHGVDPGLVNAQCDHIMTLIDQSADLPATTGTEITTAIRGCSSWTADHQTTLCNALLRKVVQARAVGRQTQNLLHPENYTTEPENAAVTDDAATVISRLTGFARLFARVGCKSPSEATFKTAMQLANRLGMFSGQSHAVVYHFLQDFKRLVKSECSRTSGPQIRLLEYPENPQELPESLYNVIFPPGLPPSPMVIPDVLTTLSIPLRRTNRALHDGMAMNSFASMGNGASSSTMPPPNMMQMMATFMQQMMQQQRGTPANITLLSPPRSRTALPDTIADSGAPAAAVEALDAGTEDLPITDVERVEPRVLRTGAISNITFVGQAAAVRTDLKRASEDLGDDDDMVMPPTRRRPAAASPKVTPKAKAKALPKSSPTATPAATPKAASAKAAPKANAKAKAKVRATPSDAIRHEMRTGSLARRRALYLQYGCTKCRWQTCTPSCWASRGTWPY
jgi:hypothetical protein